MSVTQKSVFAALESRDIQVSVGIPDKHFHFLSVKADERSGRILREELGDMPQPVFRRLMHMSISAEEAASKVMALVNGEELPAGRSLDPIEQWMRDRRKQIVSSKASAAGMRRTVKRRTQEGAEVEVEREGEAIDGFTESAGEPPDASSPEIDKMLNEELGDLDDPEVVKAAAERAGARQEFAQRGTIPDPSEPEDEQRGEGQVVRPGSGEDRQEPGGRSSLAERVKKGSQG